MNIEVVKEDGQFPSFIVISEVDQELFELIDIDAVIMDADEFHAFIGRYSGNSCQSHLVILLSIDDEIIFLV